MRTIIIVLCRVAVIALVVMGCVDYTTSVGITHVTIANKSSYNLFMKEYYADRPEAYIETSIKKGETISFIIKDAFAAPSPQKGYETYFYNADNNAFIKKFEKRDTCQSELYSYYKLTKKRGEPHSYSNPEEAWYLLEITDAILGRQ